MEEQIKKSNISGLLVLLVFAAFMISVLLVLLTGADVVQKLTARDQSSFDHRTAAQYITTRTRQADGAGMVSVRSYGGQDALVLSEDIEGTMYETLVYCYDGYLREMFAEAGMELDAEFGEKILPMRSFRIKDCNTYLLAELDLSDGQTETVLLHLRTEREVAYEK